MDERVVNRLRKIVDSGKQEEFIKVVAEAKLSTDIEKAYEEYTGDLLDPDIARYFKDNGIPVFPVLYGARKYGARKIK